jgi:hypothetical protein
MTQVPKVIKDYLASNGIPAEQWANHLVNYLDDYILAYWFEEAWLPDNGLVEDFAEFEGSDVVEECAENPDNY